MRRLSLYFWSRSGLQENPKNAKVHYNYGNLLKDSGNWEGALKHYKAAVRCVNWFLPNRDLSTQIEKYWLKERKIEGLSWVICIFVQ